MDTGRPYAPGDDAGSRYDDPASPNGNGDPVFNDAGAPLGDAEPPLDDASVPVDDAGSPPEDAGSPPSPPTPAMPPPALADISAACPSDLCWMAGSLTAACGEWSVSENFASGRYGVHAYTVRLTAGVRTRIATQRTGGSWSPALLVLDEGGVTVHDGSRGLSTAAVLVEEVVAGRGGSAASLSIVTDTDRTFTVLLTSWANRDDDFVQRLPTDASYRVTIDNECAPGASTLFSPPNFDPSNVAGGYSLLPPADPAGLYSRKADACSRGSRLLVDVIYTAALRWSSERADLPHLNVRDMNEGSCSTVDHATHSDGTHVDLTVTCGTQVSCADNSAAVDLAKILVDTGAVCGILFNDTAVQTEVNAYFASRFSYTPWRSRFMRTVTGHTNHFHVRVKRADGSCN